MTKKFNCPACGAPMEYDGKTTLFQTCQSCHAPIVVPSDMVETSRDMKIEAIVNMPSADTSSPANYATGYELKETESTSFTSDNAPEEDSTLNILREIHAGNKIMAIKLYREAYDTDLVTAKEAVETLEREIGSAPGFQPETAPRKSVSAYEEKRIFSLIYDELNAGRKIYAIKIFRETFNTSLKEAKDAVEALERGEPVRPEDYI